MAHLIESFEDLVELLEQQPDLRPRLLRVLLTEEFLRLPEKVDRLEEALTKLSHEVFLLAESHRELAESHRELAESHKILVMRVDGLAEGQKHMMDLLRETLELTHSNSKSIQSLVHHVDSLDRKFDSLADSQKEMRQDIKNLSEKG